MSTVFGDIAKMREETQEPERITHVLRNLSIHATTFKSISLAAAYWHIDIDDFIVLCAWRQSAILADKIRMSPTAKREPEAAGTASGS